MIQRDMCENKAVWSFVSVSSQQVMGYSPTLLPSFLGFISMSAQVLVIFRSSVQAVGVHEVGGQGLQTSAQIQPSWIHLCSKVLWFQNSAEL